MTTILASTSAYRKVLLEKLGIPFSCESPQIEEYSLLNESAKEMAERLAIQKARAVAKRHQQGLVIGSDQTACIGKHILGKPGSHANAIKQLQMCSGKTVTFYTGLCVIDAANMLQRSLVEDYHVTFRRLDLGQIERYLHKEQPYDCAGSFKSEGAGITLFTELSGRDPNCLIGLPLIALVDLLAEFDIAVL